MPDNNGIYTLVPGYLAQAGQTIKVSQHNPVLEDIADALNRRLMRDGTTPMNDDLPMGGNKITGLADPAAAQDGATKGYVDGAVSGLSNSLGTAAVVDHGTAPGQVPLNSDLGTMAVEDATDYVPQSDKASTLEAQAGVDNTKWMTPARVREAMQWRRVARVNAQSGSAVTITGLDLTRETRILFNYLLCTESSSYVVVRSSQNGGSSWGAELRITANSDWRTTNLRGALDLMPDNTNGVTFTEFFLSAPGISNLEMSARTDIFISPSPSTFSPSTNAVQFSWSSGNFKSSTALTDDAGYITVYQRA